MRQLKKKSSNNICTFSLNLSQNDLLVKKNSEQ